jgi:putative ABC transport system permease protein
MIAVSFLNLRNLPCRLGSSFVIVIGITGVVAVLISVLALATGFRRTIENSASSDRAIVLTRGADSEASSSLPRSAIALLYDAPGIRKNTAGRPVASAETLIIAPVARKSDGADAFVMLRGIGPLAGELRPEIKLIAGRMFRPAVHELIVGRAARGRFAGLEVGNRITLRGGDWTVVGAFESGGSSHESGMLADAETVLSAYQIRTFTSVTVRLASPESFDQFKDAVMANPSLKVVVQREPEYLAAASKPLHRILRFVAYSIGSIMAIGALFGALNTLYSAVSSRSQEIATLRAIGFGSGAVAVSVFVEALLLSLLGAGIGVAIACIFFNGQVVSTIGDTWYNSQLVYSLQVTRGLVWLGIGTAVLLAFLGALFPAVRAARLPIAAGLQKI